MHLKNQNLLFNLVYKNKKYLYLQNKVFFITGATGFLGRWILRSIDYLNYHKKLNIKLYLLVRDRKKINYINMLTKNTNIKIIEGDVCNFKFKKIIVDHIFHLATNSGCYSKEDYLKVSDTIVNGTARLLNFSNYLNIQSFSYLSSGAVYGKRCKNKQGWKETDDASPLVSDFYATYGLSKKCAESLLINNYNNLDSSKTLNIFRAFSFGGSYFNSNNNFAYDSFIKSRMLSKNIIINTDGKSMRNYMHPIDLAHWMFESLKFNNINIINTGGNSNLSLKKLAKTIAKFDYSKLPEVNITISKKNDFENYIPNLSKAESLGLCSRISLEMQIEDSLNFYYNNI